MSLGEALQPRRTVGLHILDLSPTGTGHSGREAIPGVGPFPPLGAYDSR